MNTTDKVLKTELAGVESDPAFLRVMSVLPNPDAILRRLGRSEDVYSRIMLDAHVMGDLRSIRSDLLSYESRIVPGGDSPDDIRAFELCERVFNRPPAPGWRWQDMHWYNYGAILKGYAVPEVIWGAELGGFIPQQIIPRAQRRFMFTPGHELRLLTRDAPAEGVAVDDMKFLLARHMPDPDNPYGLSVLSACFWPWTFKHAGLRFFAKFAEKYGLPWAIAEYEATGTSADTTKRNEVLDQLANMVEDALAAVPSGTKVELIESKSSGAAIHERLVMVCNKEMSKALTTQAMVAELDGAGARAASQTAQDRQAQTGESDRELVAEPWCELCRWITVRNFPNAQPPRFEYFNEAEARKDWAEVFDTSRKYLNIPASFAHDRLQIPLADDGDDILPAGDSQPPSLFSSPKNKQQFALTGLPELDAVSNVLDAIKPEELQGQAEEIIKPIFSFITEHGDDALDRLGEVYTQLTFEQLSTLVARVIFCGEIWGRVSDQVGNTSA